MDGEGDVGDERPGGGGPDEQSRAGRREPGALAIPIPCRLQSPASELERHIDARILDILVALRDFVTRQRRPAARTVRQDLVAARQQSLGKERLERPPHTLDVFVRVRDVRVLVIEPVSDPLAELLPLVLVPEHALATAAIELRDAELLDLLLAADA